MRLRFVLGAITLGAPCLAIAQEEVGPDDLTRVTMDPVEKLVGVWRVDKLDERMSSDALLGRTLRVDRQSVETLALGTCTNPGFAEQLGSITVTCLGQALAVVAWNPDEPGTIQWSEQGLRFVLHRISGTEALSAPPAAEDQAPVEGESEEAVE